MNESQFNADAWQAADPDAPLESNNPPDPGVYDVVITDAKAFTSSKGNDIAIIEWNIAAGAHAGYQWPALYGFKNEGQIKAAKATCSRIGVDVDSVSDLNDLDRLLKQRVGEYFTVEVKQNGEYRNTYVQGSATASLGSDIPDDGAFQPAPAGAENADDEPLPF